jgi:hypothetical protein
MKMAVDRAMVEAVQLKHVNLKQWTCLRCMFFIACQDLPDSFHATFSIAISVYSYDLEHFTFDCVCALCLSIIDQNCNCMPYLCSSVVYLTRRYARSDLADAFTDSQSLILRTDVSIYLPVCERKQIGYFSRE